MALTDENRQLIELANDPKAAAAGWDAAVAKMNAETRAAAGPGARFKR